MVNEASYNLSNYADLVIQQLEDVGCVTMGTLLGFKKALRDFDIQMGFAKLCPDCHSNGYFIDYEDDKATTCTKCNGRGLIPSESKPHE